MSKCQGSEKTSNAIEEFDGARFVDHLPFEKTWIRILAFPSKMPCLLR